MSLSFNGVPLVGVSPEEVTEDLRMAVKRGVMRRSCWHQPVAQALIELGHDTSYPLAFWAHIPWYGPLEEFLHAETPQDAVSDILFNGPFDDPFFVVRDGALINTSLRVHPSWISWTQRQLLLRAQRLDLAGDGGWAGPRAQGVVDRMRYLITAAGYSRDGGSLSIRMLPERWRSLDDLVQGRLLTREAATMLLAALQSGATILVAGATGSGKTTLTAGVTQELAKAKRIVFVEDGGELPRGENTVHLEANSEVVGAFSQAIRDTLRMKPNYTVVGEVRGGEAMALLQAAATGHPGIGTIHAGDVQTALQNLERMAMIGLSAEAGGGGQAAAAIVRGLITSPAVSLNIVVVGRAPNGRRTVLELAEVSRQSGGISGDVYTTNALFRYDPSVDALTRAGYVTQAWGVGQY